MSNVTPDVKKRALLAALIGGGAAACGNDRCLAYDYAAPSARFQLRDVVTEQRLCSAADTTVQSQFGAAIAHEDSCEWWLPQWLPTDGIAAESGVELTLTITGYLPVMVSLAIERNECGEAQQPLVVQLGVEPDPGK